MISNIKYYVYPVEITFYLLPIAFAYMGGAARTVGSPPPLWGLRPSTGLKGHGLGEWRRGWGILITESKQ